MCGIIGYTGSDPAVPILLDGLKKLEYRGYDSAGIAVQTKDGLHMIKASGKVEHLAALAAQAPDLEGVCGIGHTRWARRKTQDCMPCRPCPGCCRQEECQVRPDCCPFLY